MTNLDNILKSRNITLSTKVHLDKAIGFPVVMYGCESWTVKKAEHRRIDAFELWCWRRLLRVPWTARRSNQSILKEVSPGVHWKDSCWSWNSKTLATCFEELTHLKDPDSGKDLGQEEKGTTEDEMVGWHHRLNWHGFGWAPGVGGGQGGLACYSSWSLKESDTTEPLNWTELTSSLCIKVLEGIFFQYKADSSKYTENLFHSLATFINYFSKIFWMTSYSFYISICCFTLHFYIMNMTSFFKPHEPMTDIFESFFCSFLSSLSLFRTEELGPGFSIGFGLREFKDIWSYTSLKLSPYQQRCYFAFLYQCSLEKHFEFPLRTFPLHSQLS